MGTYGSGVGMFTIHPPPRVASAVAAGAKIPYLAQSTLATSATQPIGTPAATVSVWRAVREISLLELERKDEGMPFLEAQPESWQTGGGGGRPHERTRASRP